MCQNVGVCWSELAFGSKNDLQMLCEAQVNLITLHIYNGQPSNLKSLSYINEGSSNVQHLSCRASRLVMKGQGQLVATWL